MNTLPTVELVLSVGQVPDDGVGGEEGSFWGLEQGKCVEGGDGAQVGGGLVGHFLDMDAEGVDRGFDLSVAVVDGGLCAEVQFHLVC